MPSEVEIFLKKYKIRALKFIVLLLNCTLGPPNLRVGGGGPQGPLDPLVPSQDQDRGGGTVDLRLDWSIPFLPPPPPGPGRGRGVPSQVLGREYPSFPLPLPRQHMLQLGYAPTVRLLQSRRRTFLLHQIVICFTVKVK